MLPPRTFKWEKQTHIFLYEFVSVLRLHFYFDCHLICLRPDGIGRIHKIQACYRAVAYAVRFSFNFGTIVTVAPACKKATNLSSIVIVLIECKSPSTIKVKVSEINNI